MKLPVNKNIDRQRATATRNAAQRKKLIAAMLLLTVMAILWVRVLVGKGKPANVSAALVAKSNDNIPVQIQSGGVEYVKLLYVAEKHDAIVNDSFSAGNLSQFKKQEDAKDKQLNPSGTTEEHFDTPAEAAGASLNLVAIVNEKTPQAYIADMLLEKGQSFDFTYHGEIYRFRILNITADKVELDCNGIIITKRIPQPFIGTEN
jgi:hypothetical protein